MKFDQTFIAIRPRNVFEIFDLALHVLRVHFFAIVTLALAGILPWAFFNHWLIGWMVHETHADDFTSFYNWTMILLVTAQSQLATSFLTLYLGEATFIGRPKIIDCIRQVLRASFRLLWVHGGVRLLVPVMALVWFQLADRGISLNDESASTTMVGLLPLAVFAILLVRGLRPFATEIAVLEKTPLNSSSQITYKQRSSALHTPSSGMLFSRSLVAILLAIPMVYLFYAACFLIRATIWMTPEIDQSVPVLCFVPALWMTATFMAVVRFLSYIDLRIRQEGWEVELRIRSEAMRLGEAL